jgi:hypothetical protein
MRIRELLVQIARRAKGRLAFEELDEVSLDEDWVRAQAEAGDDPVAAAITRFLGDALFASIVPFCATWAERGFPRVAVGNRLAASLMATSMAPANAAKLELPWNALLVQLPDALVFGHGAGEAREAMRLVLVWRFETGEIGVRVLSDAGTAWAIRSCKLEELGEEDDGTPGVGPPLPTVEKRSLLLVRRMILGVAAGLASDANEGLRAPDASGPHPTGAAKRPPRVFSVRLPRELKSDCREAIARYVLGEPPAVLAPSGLVRGSWLAPASRGDDFRWVQPQLGAAPDVPTSVKMRVLKSIPPP